MSKLRNEIIKLAHDHPELREDLLPLFQQAKVASMPPASKRPAGPGVRKRWLQWMREDTQSRLQQAGVSPRAIEERQAWIKQIIFDMKAARRNARGKEIYLFFRNEADIHGWFTGKVKLSDVHNDWDDPGYRYTYEGLLNDTITNHGTETHADKDAAQALLDRMSDGQAQVVSQYLAHPNQFVKPREDIQKKIDEFPVNLLKPLLKVLEWAAKCPEPPPRP